MVTPRNKRAGRHIKPTRRLFLKEWRKAKGTKAIDLAIALDIERESYYRLERNWWTISAGEQNILADAIGIKPSQLWSLPAGPGQETVSLDDLIEDMPENMQQAAILAVRGIAGR